VTILHRASQKGIQATNAQFGDCAKDLPKGLVVLFNPMTGGALQQTGCSEGATVVIPAGSRVVLALYGSFVEVTRPLQAVARSPNFEVSATLADLKCEDPSPGKDKQLCVLVHGGLNGEDVRYVKKEGEKLTVRYV
jgi:hypothetical protein